MTSSDAIRAFIAAPLSPETVGRLIPPVDELRAVCRAGGIDATWSRPEGWHLTLKFLGAVASDRITPLLDRLPACAARQQPFMIHFRGFGAFPSGRHPRVLWIGLETDEGAAALEALARAIDAATAALGHPCEERPFSAHLTVGRVTMSRMTPRSSPELARWLDQRRADRLATMRVEQIALMRSDARPGGAVYTPLAVFPLA
jgi:2'-5' RNA ligase